MSVNLQKSQNKSARLDSARQASSMAELMASLGSQVKPLKKGDIIEGTVKKLTPKEIMLDIGAKSDALVLEFDKRNVDNLLRLLKVGDKVKASVLSSESEEGFPVVSLRRTLDDLIFAKLEELFKKEQVLEVNVTDSTRGGFFVETDEGIKGFLPNSQVLQDTNIVGKKVKVKIIEFDRSKKRVIFSEKATAYLTNPALIEKQIKKDEVLEVVVTNTTNHGLYVSFTTKTGELIEGFIHISEVSYQRIEDLQSMFKKGDKIKAQVLDIDKENRRVNFSIKKLEKDNFEEISAKYKKDQTIKGVVKDVKSRGVTIEIEPGVLGFIAASKIPSDSSYQTGDTVEALVEGADLKRRVITLLPVLKAKPIGYR